MENLQNYRRFELSQFETDDSSIHDSEELQSTTGSQVENRLPHARNYRSNINFGKVLNQLDNRLDSVDLVEEYSHGHEYLSNEKFADDDTSELSYLEDTEEKINDPTISIESHNHKESQVPKKLDSLEKYRFNSVDVILSLYRSVSGVLNKSIPPNSSAAIKILNSDIKRGNIATHQMLARMRMALSIGAGLSCSILDDLLIMYSDEVKKDSSDVAIDDLLLCASDAVCSVETLLPRCVSAMGATRLPTDNERIYLAFVVLHRLLHPYSSDDLLTEDFLLYGLFYCLQRSTELLDLYSNTDQRVILARSIFISDPNTAISWDPLYQPLPLVPNASIETIFSTMLRVYSVRRDVTSFMRVAWRNALSSVIAIVEPDPKENSVFIHSFKNILSVANRLLLCIFQEDIACNIPRTIQSLSRHIFQYSGSDGLHSFFLNFIVLPNIVKILKGDHESLENEFVHDKYSVSNLFNQYYDINEWWTQERFQSIPFNPTNSLIWVVWKLYTGATLLETSRIELLTCESFFVGGPVFDFNRISNQKLRNILVRLQHQSDHFFRTLLRKSNSDLAVTPSIRHPGNKLLVISRFEMDFLCREILRELSLIAIHETNIENTADSNPLGTLHYLTPSTKSLRDRLQKYLSIDEKFHDHLDNCDGEDLLILSMKNHNYTQTIDDSYESLVRTATFINRCHLTLYNQLEIIRRYTYNNPPPWILSDDHSISFIDLKALLNDTKWTSNEFALDMKVKDVELYSHHTHTFQKKRRENHHGFEKYIISPSINNQDTIPVIDDMSNKTLSTLHSEMESVLRFGTSSKAAATGTSIARSTYNTTRPLEISSYQSNPISRRNRKKPANSIAPISLNSNLLTETQSIHNTRQPLKRLPNQYDYDKDFMNSMRNHDIIPTDRFLQRRQRIRQFHTSTHYEKSHVYDQSTINHSNQKPKPFPEFLKRTLHVNDLNGDESQQQNHTNGGNMSHQDIQQLIQDYQSLFSIHPKTKQGTHSIDMKKSTDDGHSQRRGRSNITVPAPPQPIEGAQSTFFAPTEALLNRCMFSNELLEQLNNTNQSNYRLHNQAFKPSGTNIVPPTGGRIPRYWSEDDLDDHSTNSKYSSGRHSRSSSVSGRRYRSRSGSRSRSNSMGSDSVNSRTRTRSPSYHIRKDPLPDEARGIIKSSRSSSSTPISIRVSSEGKPLPQEVNEIHITAPPHVTYGVEYNQPSTEYVPIGKGLRDSKVKLKLAERFSSDPDRTIVGEPKEMRHSPSRHPNQYVRSPSPLLSSNLPSHNNRSMTNNLPIPSAAAATHPMKTEFSTNESNTHTNKQNEDQREYSLGDDNQQPAIDVDTTIPTPLLTLPANIETTSTQSIPTLTSRKRNWDKDDLKNQLIQGVLVVKHGRAGYPKSKIIRYDAQDNSLVWETPKSLFSLSTSGNRKNIRLEDIREILRGVHTDIFAKSKSIDPNCCLSIISSTRTLDMVFNTSIERDRVFKGIQCILESQTQGSAVKYL